MLVSAMDTAVSSGDEAAVQQGDVSTCRSPEGCPHDAAEDLSPPRLKVEAAALADLTLSYGGDVHVFASVSPAKVCPCPLPLFGCGCG